MRETPGRQAVAAGEGRGGRVEGGSGAVDVANPAGRSE